MINNSYYSQDIHGPYELQDIGNLELEEGGTIRGCTLAYVTFGFRPAQCRQSNAILIPTWYSGTNKIIEQVYIGKGRALYPDKYFIIVVNQIGNGFRPRRTTPRRRPGWGISRMCASVMTCAHSMNLSRKSRAWSGVSSCASLRKWAVHRKGHARSRPWG